MRGIRLAAGLAAGAALAWLPAAASAAPGCTYDAASHLLRVTANPADFSTVLTVDKQGAICGGATVVNTDAIQVTGQGKEVDLQGSFQPGFTAEPTGTSEIEIAVTDPGTLRLDVPAEATNAAVGTRGVNLNGDDDVDVTVSGAVGQVQLRRGKPPRALRTQGLTITGQGGLATGKPYTGDLQLVGGKGDDHLIGGNGRNILRGLDGNDTLDGGPLQDFFEGDAGNDVFHALDGVRDVVQGGAGTDSGDFDAGLDDVSGVP
jgi:hypothetical protein